MLSRTERDELRAWAVAHDGEFPVMASRIIKALDILDGAERAVDVDPISSLLDATPENFAEKSDAALNSPLARTLARACGELDIRRCTVGALMRALDGLLRFAELERNLTKTLS